MSVASSIRPPEDGPPPEAGMTLYLEDRAAGAWLSVVEGREGDVVLLAAPRRGGVGIAVPEGREVTLSYAVRDVPCEVLARWVGGLHIRGGCEVVLARMVGSPRRLQRRGAVRVPVQLVVRAHSSEGECEDEAVSVAVVTENLSAGGMLARMAAAAPIGGEWTVTMHLPGERDALELVARVVRCDNDGRGGRPWRIGLAFIGLVPEEEQQIVRYVFRTQREQRARETGMA